MALRLFVLIVCISCCVVGRADEAVEIPLAKMWGHHLKGVQDAGKLFPTRDVLSLANDANDKQVQWAVRKWVEEQPNEAIQQNLRRLPKGQMPPGFVVGGIDKAALLTAKMILCDGLEPKNSFSTDHELTLVFFTGGYQVFDLKSVKIEGHEIKVEYEAPEQQFQTMSFPRFAMIPLGNLPVGKYEVAIPEGERVCKSFHFEVRED